jgi:hypothetical protein
MASFDPRSRIIEIHGKDEGVPFYVHEHFLRPPFEDYGAAIDQVLEHTGGATLRLNLSHGALAQ